MGILGPRRKKRESYRFFFLLSRSIRPWIPSFHWLDSTILVILSFLHQYCIHLFFFVALFVSVQLFLYTQLLTLVTNVFLFWLQVFQAWQIQFKGAALAILRGFYSVDLIGLLLPASPRSICRAIHLFRLVALFYIYLASLMSSEIPGFMWI